MPSFWLHPREVTEQATGRWWLFVLSGVSWLFVSLIVFRFDYVSVFAIGFLFGWIAIAAGMFEFAAAAASTKGWRIMRSIVGALFIALGVVSLFTPGNTFVALAALTSFFFVLAGSFDIVNALAARSAFHGRWVGLVSGAIEVGLGFWAAGYWNRSITLLVAWVGALTLFRGVAMIVLGFKLHALHEEVGAPAHA
jgi:uncharacterized membrane protein HdeD (DUF308 family)